MRWHRALTGMTATYGVISVTTYLLEFWCFVPSAKPSTAIVVKVDQRFACLSVCLPALPPGCLTWSHVEAHWRHTDGIPCWITRSSGGELGSAWVAGQHTGPPWLAPVILPSHSSARDINNNSTSGFTLLSRVNPFQCSADCFCDWQGPSPSPSTPLFLLSLFHPLCPSSFLSFIKCCNSYLFSPSTKTQPRTDSIK